MAEDAFDRAIGYPYPLPSRSYVYHDGRHSSLEDGKELPDLEGRTPVLAVGSNQSPAQLARKFPGPDWAPIPVSRVKLKDFDSVYSAHITGYGSIAATLFHAPGTIVTLFVNWLDGKHLERMHETELGNENYEFGRLTGIEMTTETGQTFSSVALYRGLRGILSHEGEALALQEVSAENRRFRQMTQVEVQETIRDRVDPEAELETFVRSSADDREVRAERTRRIGEDSLDFSYQGYVSETL